MTTASRKVVRKRARDRCEYCHLRQRESLFFTHHIEHIIPRQHGGTDHLENLALACHRCNNAKGPNLTALDPQTGKLVRLFNPRRQRWSDHFSKRGILMLGHTAVGRATVELLKMNSPKRRNIRKELLG